MLKSIFAYWSVFSMRFVDNLHQRIKFMLLFKFMDMLVDKVGSEFMPSGGGDFAQPTRGWMEEPPQIACLRLKYTTELEKIN